MIRLTLLAIFVLFLCVYAWRDWFVSLCGLVLLTVLSQHPDMPEGLAGIPGLKPWNLVLGMVLAASFVHRRPQRQKPPSWLVAFLGAYVVLLVVGAVPAMLDLDLLAERARVLGTATPTRKELLFDLVFNPLKYIIVGVLFFYGCRTRRDVRLGVGTILLFGLLHSLIMYKTMKTMVFLGDYEDARRMIDKMIGLHANDLAAVLTMTFWSAIVVAAVLKGKWRYICLAGALVILPTIVGCHSRSAYLANVVLALVLGVIRWRRFLIAFPILAALALAVFPQIVTRLSMGFEAADNTTRSEVGINAVTAGRTHNIWAPAFEQATRSPLIGYGRLATFRTPCFDEILLRERGVPGHPHNSYLEIFLDYGIVGLLVVGGLLYSLWRMAFQVMRSHGDPLFTVVGGLGVVALVNVAALGMTSNYFYPKESMLWLTCTCGLVVRAWAMRQAALTHRNVAASRASRNPFARV